MRFRKSLMNRESQWLHLNKNERRGERTQHALRKMKTNRNPESTAHKEEEEEEQENAHSMR